MVHHMTWLGCHVRVGNICGEMWWCGPSFLFIFLFLQSSTELPLGSGEKISRVAFAGVGNDAVRQL